jgi:hypothetical protein
MVTTTTRPRLDASRVRGWGGPHFPMARLQRAGMSIRRDDRWPAEEDLGTLVILPGGEAGELKSWWNADDGSEWRWRLEFYNHV